MVDELGKLGSWANNNGVAMFSLSVPGGEPKQLLLLPSPPAGVINYKFLTVLLVLGDGRFIILLVGGGCG